MASLNRYGPLDAGTPEFSGRVFYVSPSDEYRVGGKVYKASDTYAGTDPLRALRTINRAWAVVSANVGDVIALLPGSHTLTTSVAASTAGVTMVGLGGSLETNFLLPRAKITGPSGDQAINVTAADVEIASIRFVCITAISCIDFSSAASRLYIHDCSFDMSTAVASTSTIGIDALGAASQVLIDHCYFDCDDAQGPAIDMTATLDSCVQNCVIQQTAGTWAAAITTGAATDRLVIKNCDFHAAGAGALTAAIDGTGGSVANGVTVLECVFSNKCTVPIDNFSAGDCQIANCYKAGVGAADGGTLITAIT